MEVPRRERLDEFFRRLVAAPSAGTADEAMEQLSNILDGVEDELTGIPNVPDNWREDGRIYPPQADHKRPVPGIPGSTASVPRVTTSTWVKTDRCRS
jgi:hypothetical protein